MGSTAPQIATQRHPRPRVLLVDDALPTRLSLTHSLVHEGYDVIDALDGQSAVQIVARGEVDLVIADVVLPGLEGLKVCRRIREELGRVDLPIIVIVADNDRMTRILGTDAGADDFLTQPIDESELCVRVRRLLQVKAYHDERESQRRALREELERTTTALLNAERLAFLGVSAGGIGHELANVLAVLSSAAGGIEHAINAGKKVDPEDMSDLKRAIDHVREHTRNLSRIGRPASNIEDTYCVCALVRECVRMLQRTGRLSGVNLETLQGDLTSVLVRTNRVHIEQVALNLISNAADALMMSGKPRDQRRLVVEISKRDDGKVRVEVRDSGTGMSPAVVERIFDPYFTTKPPGKGTGLGLPVSQRLLRSYESELRVESIEGVGSRFWFELPIVAPAS